MNVALEHHHTERPQSYSTLHRAILQHLLFLNIERSTIRGLSQPIDLLHISA